jgi:hypothetical protein
VVCFFGCIRGCFRVFFRGVSQGLYVGAICRGPEGPIHLVVLVVGCHTRESLVCCHKRESLATPALINAGAGIGHVCQTFRQTETSFYSGKSQQIQSSSGHTLLGTFKTTEKEHIKYSAHENTGEAFKPLVGGSM